ncbi:hypothetical protein [Actinophytocola glycyrrhizae]|uniref:Lipoprotein n=1 Tax=Actinophytocola glycyrrhizae TaxID=2044873 RepID=A0ABV9RX10_9PSEU
MVSPPPRFRSLMLVAVVAALAACTTPAAGPSATTEPPELTAEVTPPQGKTTVLDAPPGVGAAIAVSAQLFRRAPLVVVVAEGDAKGMATASAVAGKAGAPVLLAAPGPARDPLRRELARLSPRAIVAVGGAARESVRSNGTDAPVFGVEGTGAAPELPADLPHVVPPTPVAVTVLVDRARDDAAAVATARAAGAAVVAVHGTDPRADPAAIEALHAAPPGAVLAVGGAFGPAERLRSRLTVAATGGQLPGGGQVVLSGRRLVCLYGHPGTASLGVLGEQGVDAAVDRARQVAKEYEPFSDVPVVPAFEIIATVAQGSAGADGDYSGEASVESLRPWVERARETGLYVLLDLQPGRADLTAQARRYEPLLRMPHVGLAVDPEWKLGPDQLPLQQIGGIDAAEINRTAAWLAALTAEHALPQKLLVIHQFRLSMIRNEHALDTSHDELSLLIHMDGQGTTAQKNATWRAVVNARPEGMPLGWKNFYDEDHPMLTPAQTMAHEPKPLMITYQ